MTERASGLEIVEIGGAPLDVTLLAPFTIASTRLERVQNVAVRVRLASGVEGWGEAPTLPPVTREDQSSALAGVREAADLVVGQDAGRWRAVAGMLSERLPHLASVRAGVEMAVLDALTRAWGTPLHRFFGGVADRVETDITVPICPIDEAHRLAARYRAEGFRVIKTKVGKDAGADLERLAAIRRAHPQCRLVVLFREVGDTADGREAAESGVPTMMVVAMEPPRKRLDSCLF